MSEDWGNQFFNDLEKHAEAERLSGASGYKPRNGKPMLMIHNEPIRLISAKRARSLRKKGVFVAWSMEHNSHYWFLSDMVDRKPKHSVSFDGLMRSRKAGL